MRRLGTNGSVRCEGSRPIRAASLGGGRVRGWRSALLGWLVCGFAPVLAASDGVVPVSTPDRLWFWIGGGLFLLGVLGTSLVVLFGQRRQFAAERNEIQLNFDALHDRQRELEAELDRWRQVGERQRELEAELDRWRQVGERQRELEAELDRWRQVGERQRELEAEVERRREDLKTLRESEQRFRVLTQNLPVGVFMADIQGNCVYVNDCWRQMAGLTAEQITGLPLAQAVHPDDREAVTEAWRQALRESSAFVFEHRFYSPSGRTTWLSTRAVPLRDRVGRITHYLGAHADIAEIKKTEETLRASEARFRSYFELPLIGIGLTGADRRWWEVNDRLCEMLGYRRAQLLRLSWTELTYPDDLAVEMAQFDRVINQRIEGYSLEKRFLRQDGALLYASVSASCVRRANGVVDYFVTVVQDITERKQAEEQLQHLARHDPLTDLPNRALLSDRLQQAVLRAELNHTQVGVLLVDLDHFKRINDTLGHSIGDQLLRETAARLQKCVRASDTISRQGGDEFAILLPDLSTNDVADHIAQQILEAIEEPFTIEKSELHLGCSIGISLCPRDGNTVEMLLKNADSALYRAKDLGRNNYQHYLSGATIMARERLSLESSLRHAVKREQLELYYQPKWDFHRQAIVGAEALIRWNHPEHGLLPPARFIPIAEDSGLILSLGEWVLRAAVREIGQLHQDGWSGLRVAVNLSARQFRQGDLIALVQGLLMETGFDPDSLELELTETILMHHAEDNVEALRAFKRMGVRLAIDDFGTGYSSLGYLQRFPVDVLKIDRSFVTDLPESESNAAIVNAIITLAHGLGLEVVAEGVEVAAHVDFLRARGCDEGQGYYFGKPLPMSEFRALLLKDRARTQAVAGRVGPTKPSPPSASIDGAAS